jgi:ubiquinone/menaquinone biosynthesis C-methylase UbiE
MLHPPIDTLPPKVAQEIDRNAYQALYERYPDEAIWHPLPFLSELIERIGAETDGPLLDLACGDGGQIVEMPRDRVVIGVDQIPAALIGAERRSREAGRDKAKFIHDQLERLPFDAGSVSAAVLIDILSGFLDPLTILRETHRVLGPGAKLAITTFSKDDPLAVGKPDAQEGKAIWIEDFIAIFYDRDRLVRVVEDAGFELVSYWEQGDRDEPHPGYRNEPHEHHRIVAIARRPLRG